MARHIVYGSWTNGSDILKDKKGYYVWTFKTNADWEANKPTKKYLPHFKPMDPNEEREIIAAIRKRVRTRKMRSKKRRTTKKVM